MAQSKRAHLMIELAKKKDVLILKSPQKQYAPTNTNQEKGKLQEANLLRNNSENNEAQANTEANTEIYRSIQNPLESSAEVKESKTTVKDNNMEGAIEGEAQDVDKNMLADNNDEVLQNINANAILQVMEEKMVKQNTVTDNNSIRSDFSSDDTVKDPHYKKESSSSSSSDSSCSSNCSKCSSSSSSTRSRSTPSLKMRSNKDQTEANDEESIKNQKRGRKRRAIPLESIKETAKRLRNSGKAYISNSKRNKVLVPERKMGPPCTEKCKFKCLTRITEHQRNQLFTAYWQLSDLQRQREFLSANISQIEPKCTSYNYKGPEDNRSSKNSFFFSVDNIKHRVCKPFFRGTLGITDRPIRTVLKKRKNSAGQIVTLDQRGKHGNHKKVDDSIKHEIRQHIDSIPRIESHYCRADTSREFVDGGKTVSDLHRDYVRNCISKNVPYGNYVLYHKIFSMEYNISFFQPKKDQCEDCTAYNNAIGNEKETLQELYDSHLYEKKLCREERERDKTTTDASCIVAVYDLQGALPCPRGDVSNFYYVSKISTYNFTIFNLKSKDAHCFVWYEGEGSRGVTEIGSCVYDYLVYLNNSAKEKFDIIFYSDNCCGQQKNHIMLSMYVYAVSKLEFLNSITHKFLVKGHTQNEGDSVHSNIERKIKRTLKSAPIYSPVQYINEIKSTKVQGQPYRVQELSHESFYDLKALSQEVGCNFRKNSENEIFKISEAKIIKVDAEHPAVFFYKNSYNDKDFKKVEIDKKLKRSRNVIAIKNLTMKQAYKQKLPIADKKKEALLNLIRKNIIPKFYQEFYNNL